MKLLGIALPVLFIQAIWTGLASSQTTASSPVSDRGATIGVYESEANAAAYKGVHQRPLRQYLKENQLAFQVIGDKKASDPAALSQFAAVFATSCYIVPDIAAKALAKYVADGGRLVWIDGPVRCQNRELLAVLGINGGFSSVQMKIADFSITAKDHLVSAGVTDFASPAGGNPANKASGESLGTWSGVIKRRSPAKNENRRTFPAIVVTKTGKGQALLVNWIPWANQRPPRMQSLLSNTLEWALLPHLLRDKSCQVRTDVIVEPIGPQPVELAVRALGHPEFAGRTASLQASIVDKSGKVCGKPVAFSLAFKLEPGGQVAIGTSNVSLPTQSLPDGEYQAIVEGSAGDLALPQSRVPIALSSVAVGKRRDAAAQRHKLLRPLLVGARADYASELRTAKFRVDVPRMLTAMKAGHMNTCDFLIWHAKTDWDDLHDFVRKARQQNLKVWVTLCPPSEPPPSAPFGLDYIRWADEIGKLSKQYDNIEALVIDDFWSVPNRHLFTPEYIARLSATLYRHNPKIAFLPTIYWQTIGDEQFIKDYGPWIDGIVFPYTEYKSAKNLPIHLDACRKWMGPNKLLMTNVFATGTGGGREPGPRTAEYMRDCLTIAREKSDGIRMYCLPKRDLTDYRFQITAELFGKWAQEPSEVH